MYIPEHFRARNHDETTAFMRAHSFAILVSSTDDGPFATHLPLFIHEENGQIRLRGHVGKANPHGHYLERQPQCLTIFHGPHSYISPRNYAARDSVPTWNYAAVHLYGNARIFSSEQELQGMLNELIATFEPAYRSQWESASQPFRENMLRQIVGFEIIPTKIEAKFKLSQNRSREDQANVIASLEQAEDSAIAGVAQMMKDRCLGNSAAWEEIAKEKIGKEEK